MKFHVERTSEPEKPDTGISFDSLDELLAWVEGLQAAQDGYFEGVLLRYEKNPKWEGWNLEIYDDYREC